MKYFSIGRTNDTNITGHYPQTERTSVLGYHIDAFNSERNVQIDRFPDFSPKYGLDLHSKSIETDVLDKATLDFGFVVSKKLQSILQNYNLPPNKFYPIDVFHAKTQYFWFHFISKAEEIIDFSRTEVEVYKNRPPFIVEEVVSFRSISELMTFKKTLPYNLAIRYKTINLIHYKHDLFEVQGAQYFTLISERLKNRLEEENMTGLEYMEYDKIRIDPPSQPST